MLFSSITFLYVFLAATLVLYAIAPKIYLKNIILLAFSLLACARTLFKRHKDALTTRGVGMLCGMIGVLAHCYFENIFEVPYMTAYFWAFAACIMFLGFRRKKKTDLN